MHQHGHLEHAASHHLDFDSPMMVAHAELEGEVLVGLVTEATSVLAEHAARYGVEIRRVVDLGCGPGVGTCCLAQRFGAASIVAVDGSATMLHHVTERAERLGLAQRVETHQVDLATGLESLDRADVAWASMVLHHVGDEMAALRRIRELLEPGGLLAVVERSVPMRVLPDAVDLGRPGIWERLDAAWAAWFTDMRTGLPGSTTSADYPAMIEAAGFDLVADEVLTMFLDAPLDAQTRRFAHRNLAQTRAQLDGHADAADLEVLDALMDDDADDGILRRADAQLRATRHLYVGRRDDAGHEVGGGSAVRDHGDRSSTDR